MRYKRLGILFILTALFGFVKGQVIDEIKFETTPKNTRRIHNPEQLVNTITKGKSSEKEKFDAIFNWVVQNIDYDYFTYYFATGSYPMSVKQILKHKKALCINYAFLMDTLCSLADIKNVTITGYAKDELFDVHDSVYVDNHAWNAVNLDGLWYVYDVTYSSGQAYYRLTKLSQAINYVIYHIAIGTKQVVMKPKRRFPHMGECIAIGDSLEDKPLMKTVVTIKHKLLLRLLTLIRPHYVRDFKKGFRGEYYLTQPELFAIEHIPNNPAWALMPTRTIKTYQGDSAYYFLDSTTFAHQHRQGKVCGECELDVSYDPLNWSYNMRKVSLNFNPKNRFITSDCEYCIALVRFNEAKLADDSLTKVTLLDSTRSFIKYTRQSLKQAGNNERANYILQKEKNDKKVQLLFGENRQHYEFITRQIKHSAEQTRHINELETKLNVYFKKIYRRGLRIRKFKKGNDVKTDKVKVEATIKRLKLNYASLSRESDSLSYVIEIAKSDFENSLPLLSAGIWQKVNEQDSLLKIFKISSFLRASLLDNYKKNVVETRRRISSTEALIAAGIDSSLNKPAKHILTNAETILNTIDRRNTVSENCYKVMLLLIGFGELDAKTLDELRGVIYNQNTADFCWLKGGKLNYLKHLFVGFNSLKKSQTAIAAQIRLENRDETVRSKFVMVEHTVRMKKHMRILKYRRRHLARYSDKVQRYKKKYLAKLSALRKKEKKNN